MGEQEQKTKELRLARLKRRLDKIQPPNASAQLRDVLKGLINLLEDEL